MRASLPGVMPSESASSFTSFDTGIASMEQRSDFSAERVFTLEVMDCAFVSFAE